MKYYFYNNFNSKLEELKSYRLKELEQAGIKAIHVYYMDEDNDENRVTLRKVLNLNNAIVILVSESNDVSDLSWKTGVDYFIKSSKDNPELVKLLKFAIYKLLEKKNSNQGKKIRISSQGRIDYILPEDILYIIGDGSYSKIYHTNGELLVSKNLKNFEDSFSDISYLNRYGKSTIINSKKITSLEGRRINFGNGKSLEFPKYSNGFKDLKNQLLWKTA